MKHRPESQSPAFGSRLQSWWGILPAGLLAGATLTLATDPADGKDRRAGRGRPPQVATQEARNVRTDAATAGEQASLASALRLAQESQKAIQEVRDYTALFISRERVNNRLVHHTMRIKLRHEPFSVYLQFQKPHEGRQVLYVAGQNQGHLLARESGIKGLAGTFALPPTSPTAMQDSRHPITDIGIAKMLALVIAQWEGELKHGKTKVKLYPAARIGSVECELLESAPEEPQTHFKFQMTRLYLEKKTRLPVRVEQYAWPVTTGGDPVLVEEYTYTELKVNQQLGDADFDRRNPAYRL